MKKQIHKVLILGIGAVLLAALSGCTMIRNLQEMHDATVGMEKTTGEMKEVTELLYSTTESTYKDLRQGNSVIIRADALKNLEETDSMEAKISEAGIYYMSFEFQLWKSFGADSLQIREALFTDAMNQYFRDVRRYMTAEMTIDPATEDNKLLNLFALAVTMHKVNPNQAHLAKKLGFPVVSVLSLIQQALQKKSAVESGEVLWETLTEAEQDILAHEKECLYLLKLRANFLPAMVLAKVTKIKSGNWWSSWWTKGSMYLMNFEANFSELSFAEIQEYTKWIREANKTVRFLKGLDPAMASPIIGTMATLYNNMQFPSPSSAGQRSEVNEARQAAVGQFKKEIEGFKNR